MAQLTVDLSADKATLARIAQLILQFAGYEPPVMATTQPPAGQVFTESSTADMAPAPTPSPTASPAEEREFIESLQPDARRDAAEVFAPPPPPAESSAVNAVWPASPPPPPPAGIDVDLRGLPWDPRIHASTRAKTAEGNWRQKRNVDPELMTKVEAELRQTMGAPVPRVPPAPVVVPPPPFAGNAAPPAPPLPSGIPSVPASAGAATGASPGSAVSFPQLMQAITRAFTVDKTLTRPQVDAAVTKVGLASLPMLASRPDLVGAVATELGLAL